ncbi:MAG TPA: regulatory iron-sulfur-containing complex subunit RicT [Kofleriaceae bacterium]|nr:regulatory iron-sulfur-containing complex subunit RicT [Kofleriaceae bacterium]
MGRSRAPARETGDLPSDVDRGWDAAPARSERREAGGRPEQAGRGRAAERDEPREEAWGDDSAAPTAEVALSADLPADPPAGDPDPVTAFLDEPAGEAQPIDEGRQGRGQPVCNLAGIKFTTAGKIYLFDAGEDAYQVGEEVVVDTERGPRIGRVAVAPLRQELTRTGPLRRVLRRPSRSDQRRLDQNRERADAALRSAKASARELGLPIKVFRAELSLGGGKALVYFSSDEKVDVRRLMRDLSQRLHLRIELRQTGVRDEAKMVGGIGSCGLELCCTTWLPAFVPVSIKNAKDQGLVLNPTKVSGQCGRLKCCLVYEQATYAEMRRGLPKLGKRVVTASGEGRVIEVDVLRQRVRVSLVGGEVEIFAAGDVQPMFPSQPGGRPGDQPG